MGPLADLDWLWGQTIDGFTEIVTAPLLAVPLVFAVAFLVGTGVLTLVLGLIRGATSDGHNNGRG